ncbi:MAG: molybdopterin oxidoreductase family protein, partial [Rhodospirillaceae bacterium]|nr:molybdopterin oxidoreductase family protein [Rhodospirillaceae bacterium]
LVNADGTPKYPGGYADYIVNHERAPGVGPLAGWRGADGRDHGRGGVNDRQLDAYIANGCFWRGEIPEAGRYYKMANAEYLAWAQRMGFVPNPEQIILNIYLEPLQRFRLAARGHGVAQPPADRRARIERYFDPLPVWYAPLEAENGADSRYPFHALTQRPMHHYHSWGSQNAWLRQITSQNSLFMHADRAAALNIADGDWVWVQSATGRVKGQVKLVRGVNPDTVWTWNAIGKRAGTWGLVADAPEVRRAFLLNHLIADALPGEDRFANADPITGQAAWFDLRVNVAKCAPHEAGESAPQFVTIAPPPGQTKPPATLDFGREFRPGARP